MEQNIVTLIFSFIKIKSKFIATPGLGSRNRNSRIGRSGGGQRGGSYQQVYQGAYPPVGPYGAPYDPYYPGYAAAYGAGYDMYGPGYANDPYFAQPMPAYSAAGPSMRGPAVFFKFLIKVFCKPIFT